MKKLFLIVAFFTTITAQHSFAQDSTKANQLSQLLSSYYGIKNALVSSDAKTAAASATELLKAMDAVDMKAMPATEMNAFMPLQERLAFDAKHISQNNGIAEQREHFFFFIQQYVQVGKGCKAIYCYYLPAVLPHEKNLLAQH